MKFAIACDPAGVPLKEPIKETLKELGVDCEDFGINEGDPRDYPIFAVRAANAVVNGDCDRGIILCGTGVGISLAANKVEGIRAVVCSEPYSARLSRQHNNTNIVAFGARVIGVETAKDIVDAWLGGEYEGGRHQVRIDMIDEIQKTQKLAAAEE